MNSEFHLLSEKIDSLAELTQFLRRENAELRLKIAAISSENTVLIEKMQQAQQRISAVLDQLPDLGQRQDQETT